MALRTRKPLKRKTPWGGQNKFGAERYWSPILKREFHSTAEGHYAEHLYGREQNGEIADLQFQVRVKLVTGLTMVVDFKYFDFGLTYHDARGEWVWDEFKGAEQDQWKTKRNVWAAGLGPGWYRVTKALKNKLLPYSRTDYWPEGKAYEPPDETPQKPARGRRMEDGA